jgi:HK97 family phage major capsid protein
MSIADSVYDAPTIQEVWSLRASSVASLRGLADAAEGREFTSEERARVADLEDGVKAADGRVTAFLKYRETHSGSNVDTFRSIQDGAQAAATAEKRTVGDWLATELRAINTGTNPGAAFSPEENSKTVLDRLVAQSVFLASGVRVIRTKAESLVIPHMTGSAASAFVAEGDVIPTSSPSAESIVATPRKIATLAALTNEVIADANPDVLNVVAKDMTRSLALRFDIGAFEGSGTAPEFRGLRNITGIQSVSMGADGAALTSLDPFADALGLLDAADADSEGAVIVLHPRVWAAAVKIKESSGSAKSVLQESTGSDGVQRRLFGARVLLTSQIATNDTQGVGTGLTSAYVYQPSEVLAVLRQDVSVDLDKSRLFDRDQSEVRAILRGTIAVPNPEAVVRITGIDA